MAFHRYFADRADGSTIEWSDTVRNGQVIAARGIDYQSAKNIRGYVEGEGWIKVDRMVRMRSFRPQHECDARCLNATGRTMNCECACGGKNHGKGRMMVCEAA